MSRKNGYLFELQRNKKIDFEKQDTATQKALFPMVLDAVDAGCEALQAIQRMEDRLF